ncbi:hypothetical protein ACWEVO_10390, partial [Micromonospora sp. NPDC003776]
MTTGQLIVVDHVVALLGVATWFAAGATAAARRVGVAFGLLAAAVLATLARVGTVAVLAGRGWWFVQEKVLLGLPMLTAAGLAAVVVAGPRLLAARRTPGAGIPAGGVVLLLTAGYAALAGLVVTFLAGSPLTWSTALLAGALVGVAALVTVRVVAVPAQGAPDLAPGGTRTGGPWLSRRRFINLAAAAAAGTGTTGVGLLFAPAESVVTGGGPGRSSRPGAGRSMTTKMLASTVQFSTNDQPTTRTVPHQP